MKFWRYVDVTIAGLAFAIGVAIILWDYQPASNWSTYFLLSIVLFDRASKESNY